MLNKYDHMFSFVICTKLPPSVHERGAIYLDDVEVPDRHNLVPSVEDGIGLYYDSNKKSMMYSAVSGLPLKNRFVKPGDDVRTHLKLFIPYMFLMASSATNLHVELTEYNPLSTGRRSNHDEP